MPQPKVTIGICTGGTIRAETVVSLMSTMINLAQRDLAPNLLVQIGGYVDVNRNKIVEIARRQSTHLMFIDADMMFPEDGVFRLLEAGKDIIGANYNIRLDPTSADASGPTVKLKTKDGQAMSIRSKDLPREPFKCHSVATGFVLIKTSVFDRINYPWFEAFQDKNGKHHTEDVEFCTRANKVGLEVWCDPTIQMGHIGTTAY